MREKGRGANDEQAASSFAISPRRRLELRLAEVLFEKRGGDLHRLVAPRPVSYTHLDVYKRQPSLRATVAEVVEKTPVFDIHTHLYDPAFGDLLLWGVDELLIYHYLVSESFRWMDMPYEKFWAAPKQQQTEWIWNELFLKHSPVSEACRGVLTVLNKLGLDVNKRDLSLIHI